jgi:DNA-binding MarR family transcriptional regulator
MKLDGPELLVLQACRDLPKDQYGNVHDVEIAQKTRLPLPDVKAVLESLDGEGFVSKVRLSDDHYVAEITPKGKLELSQDGITPATKKVTYQPEARARVR